MNHKNEVNKENEISSKQFFLKEMNDQIDILREIENEKLTCEVTLELILCDKNYFSEVVVTLEERIKNLNEKYKKHQFLLKIYRDFSMDSQEEIDSSSDDALDSQKEVDVNNDMSEESIEYVEKRQAVGITVRGNAFMTARALRLQFRDLTKNFELEGELTKNFELEGELTKNFKLEGDRYKKIQEDFRENRLFNIKEKPSEGKNRDRSIFIGVHRNPLAKLIDSIKQSCHVEILTEFKKNLDAKFQNTPDQETSFFFTKNNKEFKGSLKYQSTQIGWILGCVEAIENEGMLQKLIDSSFMFPSGDACEAIKAFKDFMRERFALYQRVNAEEEHGLGFGAKS